MDWQASSAETRSMITNWLSRAGAALRRRLDGLRESSFQLGRSDDAWNLDADGRRLHHELDAIRSRFDGQLAT
jgi:hypothetical protein